MTSKISVICLVVGSLGPACGARTGIEDGPGGECSTDSECDDGLFCNGLERCALGSCVSGNAPDCDDDDSCTTDDCWEGDGSCRHVPLELDMDGDSWGDARCGGQDCDDARADVHPEAPELCNGIDDNCNDEVDEPLTPRWLADADLAGGVFGQSLVWMDDELALAWHSAGSRAAPLMLGFLSREGSFLREPEPVTADSNESYGPSLTWSGDALCLAYNTNASSGTLDAINVQLFDASGYRLGVLYGYSEGHAEHRNPRAAWTGRGYGLVHRLGHFGSGNSEIEFYALNSAGQFVAGPVTIADESTDSYAPHIVWTDFGFVVAWIDEQDGAFAISWARLSAEGEILSGPTVLARPTTYAWSLNLAAVSDDDLLLAWTELRYPFGSEMRYVVASASGDLRGEPAPLTPEAESSTTPVLLRVDDQLAIAWVRYAGPVLPETPAELRFAWASSTGHLTSDPISVAPAWSRSRRPNMAWTGDSMALTWLDELEAGEGVYFGRVCR